MPSKSEDIEVESPPVDINPYTVLDVKEDADPAEIKTAYRKAALKHHPDKAGPTPEEKAAANAKFQEIAFAYAVLSDERRRKRYDTTGRTEETLDLDDDDFDWVSFYREQYTDLVTEEKIEEFAKGYKGSEEEREALLAAFEKFEGNMDHVYNVIMLSDAADDEERFRDIIQNAIDAGEVEAHKRFVEEPETKWRKRIAAALKRRERDAKEVDEVKKEILEKGQKKGKKGKKGYANVAKEPGNMDDLAAMIQGRQKGRSENFLANLEAKYGGGGKRSVEDEPPEEAFASNRKKSKRG